MKILISVDIEGASGIVTGRETAIPYRYVDDPEELFDYHTGQRWVTADVNAAVEGAIEAGASEFVLHDSHGLDYRNILLDELHPSVEVVRGMPIVFYEYEDLDDTYDAAFMIAMHARPGEAGVLSHALDWPLLREIRVNGRPVGESQITAALAGYYEIPTVLITGDNMVCNEMKEWTNGQIEAAIVKKSLSRYCARCLPLQTAWGLIRESARRAVERLDEFEPFRFDSPTTLEVTLHERQMAFYASWIPQVKYDGAYTVSYTDTDFLNIYKALLAIFWVAESKMNIFAPGTTAR